MFLTETHLRHEPKYDAPGPGQYRSDYSTIGRQSLSTKPTSPAPNFGARSGKFDEWERELRGAARNPPVGRYHDSISRRTGVGVRSQLLKTNAPSVSRTHEWECMLPFGGTG